MATTNLECANATNLFYEPDGLLLRCCLLPADDEHLRHLLTFQLGYLGRGEITVDIGLDGGPIGSDCAALQPNIVIVRLRGAAEGGRPSPGAADPPTGVNLSYVNIPEGPLQYRYTVWGQAGATGYLRGQLSVVVSGSASALIVNTRSGVTHAPPRKPQHSSRRACPSIGRPLGGRFAKTDSMH